MTFDEGHWDDRYSESELLWSAGPNVFVADRLADLPPGRALDVAAGEGRNAIWLAERGWEVTAVDFSTVAIEKSRAMAEQRSVTLEWVESDVLTWEPTQPTYDLVLLAYLHLEPAAIGSLIARMWIWVAEGGHLFLVGHATRNLEEGYGGPPDPERLWDAEQLVSHLGEHRLIEGGVVEREVATDDGPRVALDTIVHVAKSQS